MCELLIPWREPAGLARSRRVGHAKCVQTSALLQQKKMSTDAPRRYHEWEHIRANYDDRREICGFDTGQYATSATAISVLSPTHCGPGA